MNKILKQMLTHNNAFVYTAYFEVFSTYEGKPKDESRQKWLYIS